MTQIYQLIRIDFDTMENRNPISEKCIMSFVDDEVMTAEGKYKRYIENMAPIKLYTGWDGHMYPKFRKDIITAE